MHFQYFSATLDVVYDSASDVWQTEHKKLNLEPEMIEK